MNALRGADVLAAIRQSGVEFVVSVPDIVTSQGLLWPLSRDAQLRLVRVCKEDEGVSICAGLAMCDRRALLLIQQTGLLDSLNALRAIGVEYGQPICMLIGLQGKEPDRLPAESAHYGVRVVEPVLDAMGVRHVLLQDASDLPLLADAIDSAYRESIPVAVLVGSTLQ